LSAEFSFSAFFLLFFMLYWRGCAEKAVAPAVAGIARGKGAVTRMRDFTPSLEDYIEALGMLADQHGETRLTDVAERLKLSKASVSRAMKTLREMGYVEQRRYGSLHLTGQGKTKADEVRRRHELLERFLTGVLGVSPETAREDACGMEHAVSEETIQCWEKFMLKFPE